MLGNVRIRGSNSSVVNKNEEMSYLGYQNNEGREDHNIQRTLGLHICVQKDDDGDESGMTPRFVSVYGTPWTAQDEPLKKVRTARNFP